MSKSPDLVKKSDREAEVLYNIYMVMKKGIKVFSFVLLATMILISYQNCSSEKKINSGLKSKIVQDEITIFKNNQSLFEKNQAIGGSICDQMSYYVCEVRSFSPDLVNSQRRSNLCSKLESQNSEVCLDIMELDFSSKSSYENCSDCTSTDIQPGGQFNYQEVSCYHSLLKSSSYFIYQEANNFKDAVNGVYEQCQKLAQKSE